MTWSLGVHAGRMRGLDGELTGIGTSRTPGCNMIDLIRLSFFDDRTALPLA
jgi:hypothetical protein